MTYSLAWLADVLRAAGVKVVEVPGWQSRGRGEMGAVKGVICHHTAGPKNPVGTPGLSIIINGRGGPSPLPGPLSQLYLAPDGTCHVVAAGRCNHAGAGRWRGMAGNSSSIGIEAENPGDGSPWPAVQTDAYAQIVAAILSHLGLSADDCCGHKEFATPRGRKIDPAFAMDPFRARVAHYMHGGGGAAPPNVPPEHPTHAMLKRGAQGPDVGILQRKLDLDDDEDFGELTENAVKAFQKAHGLKDDGAVGPKTWTALGL